MSAVRPTVLERILRETRAEVDRRRRERPLGPPAPSGAADGRPFRDALLTPGIGVIAEFKRRSPSAGELHEAPALAAILAAYQRGGAVAASVLTEGPNFGGALADLTAAREACELPLLRKDFILDRYQLYEARASGADAVLLIAAALQREELSRLHSEARSIGLDVLVEVHDSGELDSALAVGADIVGVNNRDLRDFTVDLDRTERLLSQIPDDVIVVSESGIAGAEQVRRLGDRGVHAVLVGEALMRAEDPAAAVAALTGAAHPPTVL
ncbi:MAG TPA: indole-3-glycerol phosphate synthase TrpC [Solirubrobacteraceae bacterium]|nr:indole-3-glycerol phosphate synthase TrpC [Solirubrobacteraceae bacterium]